MELTDEHYRRAAIAHNAFWEKLWQQNLSNTLLSFEAFGQDFDALRQDLKDAWAAVVIALSRDADNQRREAARREVVRKILAKAVNAKQAKPIRGVINK